MYEAMLRDMTLDQGKDVVFTFIIKYNSLTYFGPKVTSLFLYEDLCKSIFWLVLKLELIIGL